MIWSHWYANGHSVCISTIIKLTIATKLPKNLEQDQKTQQQKITIGR